MEGKQSRSAKPAFPVTQLVTVAHAEDPGHAAAQVIEMIAQGSGQAARVEYSFTYDGIRHTIIAEVVDA